MLHFPGVVAFTLSVAISLGKRKIIICWHTAPTPHTSTSWIPYSQITLITSSSEKIGDSWVHSSMLHGTPAGDSDDGVITRSVLYLFEQVAKAQPGVKHSLKCVQRYHASHFHT